MFTYQNISYLYVLACIISCTVMVKTRASYLILVLFFPLFVLGKSDLLFERCTSASDEHKENSDPICYGLNHTDKNLCAGLLLLVESRMNTCFVFLRSIFFGEGGGGGWSAWFYISGRVINFMFRSIQPKMSTKYSQLQPRVQIAKNLIKNHRRVWFKPWV